jgi:predicted nucleic acid-binding protein
LLARYDALFGATRVDVVDVTASVIDRATDLRGRYRFKTPDCIHLATAVEIGASAFWTGDAGLRGCSEVNVVVLAAP